MFVTMPHFEQPLLSKLAGGGQQYWRAVTLSAYAPWYVFLYEAPVADARVLQSTLVAWEETVLNLLEVVPRDSWRGIYRLEPATPKSRGGWRFREVVEIWTPTQGERGSGLTAVLLLQDDAQLRDPHLRPVAHNGERQLSYCAKVLSGVEPGAGGVEVAGKSESVGRGGAGYEHH